MMTRVLSPAGSIGVQSGAAVLLSSPCFLLLFAYCIIALRLPSAATPMLPNCGEKDFIDAFWIKVITSYSTVSVAKTLWF
jgi:hypothetical protein